MTWTASTALRDHLAGTGSVESAVDGGSLKIYNATDTLLSSHAIGTVSTTTNTVTVPFASSTVEAGISAQTADNAEICNSAGTALLSTDNVGEAAGSDIPFNTTTGWNAGDSVAPGSATIPVTVSAT